MHFICFPFKNKIYQYVLVKVISYFLNSLNSYRMVWYDEKSDKKGKRVGESKRVKKGG